MHTKRTVLARALDTASRTLVIALAVYGALDIARSALAQDAGEVYLPHVANAAEVESLGERVAALEDTLVHVAREGNDIYVTGANLHVVNGEGRTATTNGLGNVIVGYNEVRPSIGAHDRGGSHMYVAGIWNDYSSYGGVVVGKGHAASAPYASVISGRYNEASGAYSAVIGGDTNVAGGVYATVTGGEGNLAGGPNASVSGGSGNTADAVAAAVTGGAGNSATGETAWVGGGYRNEAHGKLSSIGGGDSNRAFGASSSVSGGVLNLAFGDASSVSGGSANRAEGHISVVGGGTERLVTGTYSWRAGDLFQDR